MDNIKQHIEYDKSILDNPTISPQKRRHIQDELKSLERYQKNHPEDEHDPSSLEMYCDENPEADECKIYEN